MSINQSRANRNESHYRKPGRTGNSAQQRSSSGRGGKGGGGGSTGLPPSPSSSSNTQSSSFSTNRSFKKPNGQGTQSWVIATSANSDSNAAVACAVQNGARAQPPLLGASDAPVSDVTIRPSDLSSQRSNRAIPRAPSSQSASGTSASTAPTSTTQGDASRAFPLQFGSFVNGVQIPARTSSAPPNLDEQKHDQAQHDSFRSGPMLPISSIPREQQLRKDVQQSNGRESHPLPQAKRDLHTQVPAAPAVTNTQSTSALHLSGVSVAIPLQKQQFPIQLSVPSPQIQAQGVTTTSLQMPMSLPVGTSTQVQQQVFIPGLQTHPLHHQGMVHQGHGLNFSPHMGHQLGPQLGNLGIGINPQFAQQQAPRRTVKITHPETHEELRLDKRNDMNLDGGLLGPRSHPKSLQSQTIPYAPTHQINYYPGIQSNPMFFQSPTSIPLTSTEMASQATRINYPVGQGSQTVSFMKPSTLNPLSVSKTGPSMHWIADSSNFEHAPSAQAVVSAASSASRQVTVKPATGSIGEKVGSSLVSASSPVDDESEMPKLLRSPVEASSIHSQGDSKICSESYVQQPKSIPEPTVSIPFSVTTKHSVVSSAAVSVERLPPSTSSFPPVSLTGETASTTNNTEGRREPMKRSNSIKDWLKKPSKKDQRHSQPQLQAETSNLAGSSRDVTSYPDNIQAPPSKLVEPSASILTWPSLGLEHSRSLEGGVSETVECTETPAPSETCEDVSVSAGESLSDVHAGVADAPVEGTNSTRVGEDSTCGTSSKSSVETVSDNLGEVHNVKQDDCTLQDIQLKEGISGSSERWKAELSEQPQPDSDYIDGNTIKMPADSFSCESSKVGNDSEDFNSTETTVLSEIVTMEIEQNELKNEARSCSLEVDKVGCNLVRFTGPSSDSNDSEISPYNYVLPKDCCEVKSLTLEASKSESVCLDSQEIPLLESGKTHLESPRIPTPVISAAVSKLGEKVTENANGGLVRIPLSGSKDKLTLEVNRVKCTNNARGKKKKKEFLQKADAAGTTSDLYMAYKGPNEKPEPAISSESVDSTSSIDVKQTSLDVNEEDVVANKEDGLSEAEPDDWEDAADISSPKLKISDNGEQVHGGLQRHEEDVNGIMDKRKYSRDFLLTFSEQCTDLPADFEIKNDIVALVSSKVSISKHADRNPYPSSGRIIDRPTGVSRPDQRGSGMVGVDRWNKSPGPFTSGQDPRVDISQGGIVGFRPGQGGNHGALRNLHGQAPGQYVGGILSGPLLPLASQGGIQRHGPDFDRWHRAADIQRGLIPSPQSPLQVMHKATKKYELRKVTDEEEAKQRQLKAILNKLTPQNFEKLFEKVKEVNIDNAVTLSGVISQIFDKALTEPTFCEMYANFCYYLAGELPDFTEDNEKITFKRLLLNKCQEEFERGEREQAEANRVEEDGEVKQSEKEREVKKIQARRRMLGNIRLIGELYKKKMLTERIMHECIKKLLGQYQNQNPDEEDIEALCKLMSTIGEIIDHPKAKQFMDAYFDIMMNLSNNMKLSSRVRFMLKDAIDLRKNKWQQRRKVEGPKKIEEVHRDAAQERQAQASRLARGSSNSLSTRRGPPLDFSPRGSTMFSSPNTQMGAFRGFPSQVRGVGTQDVRWEDKHIYENRTLSVPLPHRPVDDDSITLGPQGGLARGLSVRGQPMLSSAPTTDISMGPGDSRRMTADLNGFSSISEWTYNSREEPISRYVQERFMGQPAFDQSKTQEHSSYGNRDLRNANHSFDRSMAGPPSTCVQATSAVTQNVSSEVVWPEERLRDKSIAAIREFYSAKDENEVTLCIRDLNSPSFHSSMISIWVTDSFERKDRDRDLLARLLVTLTKSRELTPGQLIQGVELVLASLEDAVTDAPKAAEFLGRILGIVITENVVSLREIGKLIHEGGEEPDRLLQIGLGYEVFESTLEMIRSEKGESFLCEICTSSNSRLEDFRPPDTTK